MCLIIQGKPKHFTKEIIRKAFNGNPHGFGLMYLCKDTNRVITKKFFTKKINKILKTCKEHFKKADEIALHFRITTNGNTNNKNCHPFQVLNNDNDRADLFLMHNSPKLPSPLLTNQMSDTYYFSKIILRPIVKSFYKLLDNEKFISCIETIAQAETDSRILLLDNFTKSFQFLGNWNEHKNLKYSNSSLIPYTPPKKDYYNYGYGYSSNSGNYKSIPKISVQEKPVYDSEFWNEHNSDTTTPKDLSDLNGLVQTMDKSEIKLLCDERPELIAYYILAVYSGYDLTDEKDCELYFDETKQQNIFDDTKPYGNTTTTKKGVNNAK